MQLFYTHYSLNSDTYNQRVHSEFLQQQQNPTKINDSNRATREEKKKKKKDLGLGICFSPVLLQNYFGVSS